VSAPRRRILFAHGAGLGKDAPWMRGWAARLGALGRVTTFDYPYMAAGKRRPDPLPALIAHHRRALAAMRGRSRAPIVLAGKSMGSRVGCHVALEDGVDALVCFGYPLVSSGKTTKIRDEVLLALGTPILFVQGTKDELCPLELLRKVRRKMKAKSEVVVVEGGDHSLLVRKRALAAHGETQDDVDARVLDAVASFLAEHAPTH
jgi:predicted alpha/beta-hydrolase family hydrolase